MTNCAFNHTTRLANEAVRVAEADLDFVYSSNDGACFYYPTSGNPQGCVFGAAARNIDTSFDEYHGNIACTLHAFYLAAGYTDPEDLTEHLKINTLTDICEDVQEAQDTGICWGLAISPLKKYLRENDLLEDDLK